MGWPSIGLIVVTSLYAETPTRSDTAMTGEITLAGLVLPIGGVKEKILAARRAGIHRVLLPRDNQKDLRELPEHVRDEMEFVFVERVSQMLREVLPQETDVKTKSKRTRKPAAATKRSKARSKRARTKIVRRGNAAHAEGGA